MTRPLVSELVLSLVNELGLPDPGIPSRKFLLRDRLFVGEKYRFNGGYAVWLAEKETVEVFDEAGNLLKTVGIAAEKKAA